MNKSVWIGSVIAFQVLLFGVLLGFGFSFHNMNPMTLENWMFAFLITFVTLNYLYMGFEWGFGASGKPSEEEEVATVFNAIDRNNDGVVSRDEARRAGFVRVFDKFDTDHDGRLAPGEFHRAYTCGALHYGLLAKIRSFFTLGLASVPAKA